MLHKDIFQEVGLLFFTYLAVRYRLCGTTEYEESASFFSVVERNQTGGEP